MYPGALDAQWEEHEPYYLECIQSDENPFLLNLRQCEVRARQLPRELWRVREAPQAASPPRVTGHERGGRGGRGSCVPGPPRTPRSLCHG